MTVAAWESLADMGTQRGDRATAEQLYPRILDEQPSRSGTTGSVEISLAEVLLDSGNADARAEALNRWTAGSSETDEVGQPAVPLAPRPHSHRRGRRRRRPSDGPSTTRSASPSEPTTTAPSRRRSRRDRQGDAQAAPQLREVADVDRGRSVTPQSDGGRCLHNLSNVMLALVVSEPKLSALSTRVQRSEAPVDQRGGVGVGWRIERQQPPRSTDIELEDEREGFLNEFAAVHGLSAWPADRLGRPIGATRAMRRARRSGARSDNRTVTARPDHV